MASAPLQSRDRPSKRRPFTDWVKQLTNRKHNENSSANKLLNSSLLRSKHKKLNGSKNNPYPASGFVPRASSPRSSLDGAMSFATSNVQEGSIQSDPLHEREGNARSAAPTVNTKTDTLRSGHSRAATANTAGGNVSSIDGAPGGSTFSSPTQSLRSLTTTLTTIQSNAAQNALGTGASGHVHNQVIPHTTQFSHQYPISPATSALTASAIPRHVSEAHSISGSGAADNASIMTLASSSKRRRRSIDTDASVRALAPSSVWGGSRESLPLSVLSSNIEGAARPPATGYASVERASMYSSTGVSAPLPDRSSYYSGMKKDLTDSKSMRSVNNADTRSQYDARSIAEGRPNDVASTKGYESSVRSGAVGHGRHDSIPSSIGMAVRPMPGALSRRSSDWTTTDHADTPLEVDGGH